MTDDGRSITVTIEDGENRGRYVGRVAGLDAEGEITFTHHGPDLISADHTGAPDALKGTGVAAAMVDFLVADARERGFKVIPICPYVRARYKKNIQSGATSSPPARARSPGCPPARTKGQ